MDYFQAKKDSLIITILNEGKCANLHAEIYYPPPPTPFLGEWKGFAEKLDLTTIFSKFKPSLFLYASKNYNIKTASIETLSFLNSAFKKSITLEKEKIVLPLCRKSKFYFKLVGG